MTDGSSDMSTFKRFKDSVTGLFVSKAEAAKRPDTTHAQTDLLIAPAELEKLVVAQERAYFQFSRSNTREAYYILSGQVNDLIARAKS